MKQFPSLLTLTGVPFAVSLFSVHAGNAASKNSMPKQMLKQTGVPAQHRSPLWSTQRRRDMALKREAGFMFFATSVLALATLGFAQGDRGKAELRAGDGSITIDYGRPALKGRDMIGQLAIEGFWRMGSNQATTITTPVDLIFGRTRVPKGTYRLLLNRVSQDEYELVFNTQTAMEGAQRDESKDIAKAALKMESLSLPVETFMIELKPAANGGLFLMEWANIRLSAAFSMK